MIMTRREDEYQIHHMQLTERADALPESGTRHRQHHQTGLVKSINVSIPFET